MTKRRFDNILETVGGTPVVRINKLAPEGVNVYVKVEAFNPLGSVKDRLALGLIEHAERTGQLSPGQTVIEATSGNTGIGLAMVCAQKGYPLVVTMAENFSVERRKMMRFLGARVVLTPASDRGMGMLAKAQELAQTHGWFLCRQFENEANADVHSETTAKEILRDFDKQRLDYWVTGFGTGGTLKGVARVLKEQRPDTRIAVCEPENSPVLASGVPQPRTADGTPSGSHPLFRTHLMQGWSPDFVPKLAEDTMRLNLVDEFVPVNGDEAVATALELAQKEGIFTGISGGATLASALKLARSAPQGATILAMLPDTGERYLSTPLFEGIPTEMSEEELEISRSSPSYRFDVCSRPGGAGSGEIDEATPEAREFVAGEIAHAGQPVVMFAFEYCEFCWSVRKLFDRCAIAYHTIELDSAAYQQDNWGGKVRAALKEKTASTTVPQVFVGGEFVGGCVEVLDAYKDGQLQQLLDKHSVEYDRQSKLDPHSCLPSWLHSR